MKPIPLLLFAVFLLGLALFPQVASVTRKESRVMESLREQATRVVRRVAARAARPVIGVGGVSDAGSAREKLSAGAALVQLYTGLVYGGPALPRQIARGL
jgi:dihydroorotate dehydrogenase